MRNVFARGAAAGAAAGLLTSLAAYVWLEPVLGRAIALEGPSDGAGPVSRETQNLLGMPAGFLLVGVALGLLFAAAYHALPREGTPWRAAWGWRRARSSRLRCPAAALSGQPARRR